MKKFIAGIAVVVFVIACIVGSVAVQMNKASNIPDEVKYEYTAGFAAYEEGIEFDDLEFVKVSRNHAWVNIIQDGEVVALICVPIDNNE